MIAYTDPKADTPEQMVMCFQCKRPECTNCHDMAHVIQNREYRARLRARRKEGERNQQKESYSYMSV